MLDHNSCGTVHNDSTIIYQSRQKKSSTFEIIQPVHRDGRAFQLSSICCCITTNGPPLTPLKSSNGFANTTAKISPEKRAVLLQGPSFNKTKCEITKKYTVVFYRSLLIFKHLQASPTLSDKKSYKAVTWPVPQVQKLKGTSFYLIYS